MTNRTSRAAAVFDRLVLGHPGAVVGCVLVVVGLLCLKARYFSLDASAETLVLEDDQDLRYARLIGRRYGQEDFLVVTYTPNGDLFSGETLAALRRLRDELSRLEHVSSVRSILDVPLIESGRVSIESLKDGTATLESATVDQAEAAAELRQSPLYRNLLVSPDGRTTALQVVLEDDEAYDRLLRRRDELREKEAGESLSPAERDELTRVSRELRDRRDEIAGRRHEDVAAVRGVLARHASEARLFLGGVSMIADDMITFIKRDLKVFGLGGAIALGLALGVMFRGPRWICLPMACCIVSAVVMIGLLGWLGWQVTVISANFISLQLIMTMAIAIHLAVQYRECLVRDPLAPNRQLILDAVRLKWTPCVYAVLTTMAGFASLLLCNILPVIMLGKMMIVGLAVSLIISFLLFPALLALLPKAVPPREAGRRIGLTVAVARFTEAHGGVILGVSGFLLLAGLVGIRRLEVENRFIDYFRTDTEIHQGMKVIDQQLGGTTPLDVIVEFGEGRGREAPKAGSREREEEFDEFAEFEKAAGEDKYWFTEDKMRRLRAAHRYLEGLPEIGKVLSLATVLDVAEKLTDGRALDSFDLALLYSETPKEFKSLLVEPYVSVADNQARLLVRVRDSEESLRRDALLRKIKAELPGELGLGEDDVRLAGLLVLYNNMLQSLFDSQIRTMGFTLLLLSVMFLILFRSWWATLLALVPNALPVVVALGVMGWLDIPLDMMTITIAAIGVGIAVDDTVHYVHRFKDELREDGDYVAAMHRCHGSVGLAMYYTSATITIGFAILGLSSFIPTVTFGLLTGLVMVVALIADLMLLPRLLILAKPFGRGGLTSRRLGGEPSSACHASAQGGAT
ncbi:MAG: MMPL family transporter [Phycisphaerae bacterium]|nr:MMPL family transporter [Phycisphaerae bacterium]